MFSFPKQFSWCSCPNPNLYSVQFRKKFSEPSIRVCTTTTTISYLVAKHLKLVSIDIVMNQTLQVMLLTITPSGSHSTIVGMFFNQVIILDTQAITTRMLLDLINPILFFSSAISCFSDSDSICNLLRSALILSLIHIWRCRRSTLCRSRWSPYH